MSPPLGYEFQIRFGYPFVFAGPASLTWLLREQRAPLRVAES
jgi:hypothetical protein